MKKRLGIAMTVALIFAMGINVLAAPSVVQPENQVTVKTNEDGTATLTNEYGTTVTMTVDESADAKIADGNVVLAFADEDGNIVKDVTVEIKAIEETETTQIVEEALKQADQNADASKTEVLAAVNISVEGFKKGGSATIPLQLPSNSVKAGESVYVIHKLSDGTVETLSARVFADDVVTITTSSFSPFIIVKGENPTISNNDDDDDDDDDDDSTPAATAGSTENTAPIVTAVENGTEATTAAAETTATETTAAETAAPAAASTTPKTADTAPLAILFAAVCISSLAFMSVRYRYNR
jgi:hypothetical protein